MRLLGSAFAVLAILLFMARGVTDHEMARAVAAGIAGGDFLGFIVALWGQAVPKPAIQAAVTKPKIWRGTHAT